jgi:glycosyltransferase involved in cell wall biosynthesis
MKQVLKSVPNTKLVVVGDGPDRRALQSLGEALEIDRNIVWMGAKSHEETFQLYGMMDVVVVPSRFEGFGLAAAEAMAAGVPVVASDADGLREVIDDGITGYLVPFGDTSGMSSSIVGLLSDPLIAARFGEAGKKRVRELFPLARFHNAIKAVYEKS